MRKSGTLRWKRGLFDVVYPNEWEFSVDGTVPLDVLFVNKTLMPLSMASLQVRSLADDNPTAFVRVVAAPTTTSIAPGLVGGLVSPIAEPILFDSGLVIETRTDINSSYASIEVVNAPSGTYDISVDVVLGLDGLDVPLHITVHVLPGPTIFAEPVNAGTRTPIFR